MMNKFVKDKIRVSCETLWELSEKNVRKIPELRYISSGYKKAEEKAEPDENWQIFKRHDRVHGKDSHFWFYTEIRTPEVEEGQTLVLELITSNEGSWDALNPQGLIYLNGVVTQGMDINHRQVILEPDKDYKVLLYFYTGMIDSYLDVMFDLKTIDQAVRKLYYDMKVPYDAAMCFDEDDYTHIKIMKALEQTCNRIDFRKPGSMLFYESIAAAGKYIQEEFYEKMCGASDVTVSYIGHTHIDVAWLWSLDQTREKTQRTFSTVLQLMDKYPEYIFMSSQPQLYEYLKQEEPELYERVKEKVKEGRWEVEGAMWLESDCNIPSGESFVRQILHGKRFMKQEFGVESHILWMPDVFGYSGSLPQIMKKSGVDTFVTSKLSLNEVNKMPYDSFIWEGIDGSEVFAYFLSAQDHSDYLKDTIFTTYVGTITPQMNLGTWERFQQKDYTDEVIVTFGYGDGGGGPTAEMLETQRRLAYGIPGMPKTQISRAGDFLARAEKNFRENCRMSGRTPKWVGELYFQMCRGTYTSIAKNKKNNRQCEFLLQEAETLSVTEKLLTGGDYQKQELYDGWQTVLLNQFHDIIPGSSIHEVYEVCDRHYAKVKKTAGGICEEKLDSLASGVSKKGYWVYNPNSFTVDNYAKFGDDRVYVKNIPAMGWKVVTEFPEVRTVQVQEDMIESPHYRIQFDESMNIVSLYDKDYDRQVLCAGGLGNQLRVYEDFPRDYDNWQISDYYKQKMWEISEVQSVQPVAGNGYGGYRVVKKYMDSTITQTILVYSENRRIDFETEIDWHEKHLVLKAEFPTTIHAQKAAYEVQFGYIERPTHKNTSWDEQQFEVWAQKWADLSEEGYGVSILNDCKYGYSTEGSRMTITLLKCGTYPDEEADQGYHSFTYSLYPHGGSFKQGGTVQEAYLLNKPLIVKPAEGAGTLPETYSLISCDQENVFIDTVKEAEDSQMMVVRLYEAWDKKTEAVIRLGFEAKKISLGDMMENPVKELGVGKEVTVQMSNLEIVTLLIEV